MNAQRDMGAKTVTLDYEGWKRARDFMNGLLALTNAYWDTVPEPDDFSIKEEMVPKRLTKRQKAAKMAIADFVIKGLE